MDRKWLPLNALRAFEAAGQHLSFTAAANSLTVAQSAVSRHVIVLENFLGVALFERRPQQLVLTEAGRHILPVVSKSFDRIDQALGEVIKEKGRPKRRAQGRAADLVRSSSRHSDLARFPLRERRHLARDRLQADDRTGGGRRHRHRHRLFRTARHRRDPRPLVDGALDAAVQPEAARRDRRQRSGAAHRRERPPASQDRRPAAAFFLGNVRALDRASRSRGRSAASCSTPSSSPPSTR